MQQLLNNLTFKKTYLKKSSMTSGNEYLITLKNKRNSKIVKFHYHDNIYNESDIEDILYCFTADVRAFESCYNFKDFCDSFGYSTDSIQALKIYNACRKQHERFNKIFDEEEQKKLIDFYDNY